MDKKVIITIGREYGSGGREIGQRLAKELDIPYYDKELLNIAAQESGISHELFKINDEKSANSFFRSFLMGSYPSEMPLHHKVFLAQFDAIKKIAQDGACVIVGRCADYALSEYPHCIHVFIHGKMEDKLNRVIHSYGVSPDKAEETIVKTDKNRSSYYEFYTGQKWKSLNNYHFTFDSSTVGIDNIVNILKDYVIKEEAEILRRGN